MPEHLNNEPNPPINLPAGPEGGFQTHDEALFSQMSREAAVGAVAANQTVTQAFYDDLESDKLHRDLEQSMTDSANANRHIEFDPENEKIDEMLANGADGYEVGAYMATERAENGVTQNEDGSLTLSYGGEQTKVNEEGVPTDIVPQSNTDTDPTDTESAESENPYERFTDEQMEQIRNNTADSLAKGVLANDREFVYKAGKVLATVQREFERRFPDKYQPRERKIDENGVMGTTEPEPEIVSRIAEQLQDTDEKYLVGGMYSDISGYNEANRPTDEAKLEAGDVFELMNALRYELGLKEAFKEPALPELKNRYSLLPNDELNELAQSFPGHIKELEDSGRMDEANKARTYLGKIQEVVDRRTQAKNELYGETEALTAPIDQVKPEVSSISELSDDDVQGLSDRVTDQIINGDTTNTEMYANAVRLRIDLDNEMHNRGLSHMTLEEALAANTEKKRQR